MVRGPFFLQAEARRFLSALGRRAVQAGNSFSVHQLFDLSDHLQLKVPDMRLFIDELNDAGMIFYACIRTGFAVLLCCFHCFETLLLLPSCLCICCVRSHVAFCSLLCSKMVCFAGELLKKGPQTYALQSVPVDASQPATSQVSRYSAASQSVNNS